VILLGDVERNKCFGGLQIDINAAGIKSDSDVYVDLGLIQCSEMQ
jgi:hypothetical protein